MSNLHILNDSLNLRDSILLIVEYIRDEGSPQASPRTIVSFLNTFFKELPLDEKVIDNVVINIQKMFSGNLPIAKIQPFADKILSNEWDEILLKNIQCIVDTLYSISKTDSFFILLYQKVSLRFFSRDEYKEIQIYYENKDYSKFLLSIIKHGLSTMYNIPCFFADRMYDEALTYDYNSPLRFALMRTAAEKGNKNAALEYGNFVAKHGPYPEAFRYLMLGLPLPAAVWNIAFLLENQLIGPDHLRQFKSVFKIDEKITSEEFDDCRFELESIICTETNPVYYNNLVCAYKTYFYLAYKGFFKAFNSMAKLLTSNKVKIANSTALFDAQSLTLKYYQNAIRGCNVIAMCNEGSRILNEYMTNHTHLLSPLEEHYMLELIKTSADADVMTSCYNLGRYYEFASAHQANSGISRSEIEKIYEKAIELDIDGNTIRGDLLYRLGSITTDISKKKSYLQNALLTGVSDAAYHLALMLFDDFTVTKQTHKLLEANELISDNISYMTEPTKEYADKLREIIKDTI